MNSRRNALIPLFIGAAIALGIIIGRLTDTANRSEKVQLDNSDNKLSTILNLINAAYVDTIDTKQIIEDAIPVILEKLDPHTVYIPAKNLQQVNEELEGNFGGIGVQFSIQEDTVVIVSVISGGPSSLLGLQPGDRIIAVGDSAFVGKKINNEKVMKSLRGEVGTEVKVTVKRNSSKIDFKIKRDLIPINSVDVAYMINDTLGYIKIDRFAQTTYNEMIRSIAKLKSEGCQTLIVDLRGNSGGFLETAIKMCNEFLAKNDLIVYTEGRTESRYDVRANGVGTCQNMGVVVLIDEYSASASEIFAGAMQDNDRGLIIGRRSFGKGLVQQQMPLSDSSAIRLTIARYHTPSGRCIQRPYNKGTEDYYEDIYHRYEAGEFFEADSIKFDESLKFTTRKGRTVYGGGGIMPDIFVPRDTTDMTNFYYNLRAKGIIYSFALDYADRNRAKISEAKDANELLKKLDEQKIFDELMAYTQKKGLKINNKEASVSRKLIITETQAYIARNILDDNGFYPIIHRVDNVLKRAIEVEHLKNN